MAMTRAQWNALQKRLPVDERTPYEDYLVSTGEMPSPATFTPSALAAKESGAIGATSIATQMTAATQAVEADIATRQADTTQGGNPWDNPPYPAPAGKVWKWIGAKSVGRPGSGSWKLYDAAGSTTKTSDAPGKTIVSITYEGTGKNRVKVTKYSDGTETREPAPLEDSGIPERPVGVPPAFVWDPETKTWKMPPYPQDGAKYTWDDAKGWVSVKNIPGSTGFSVDDTTRNLAKNTFKNTLALLFGPSEADQPWIDELYNVVSGYYKTGSTVEEAINLSLRDVRNNPNMTKFTKRFRAIFSLEDMVREGKAIYAPTISEYVEMEQRVGDIFRVANLSEIATQDFIADVLGKGKSVTTITNLVNDVFNLIDNAPQAWKDEVSKLFPTTSRTDLAKTILLGKEEAVALEKKVQVAGVKAAAQQQGLSLTEERATDIFAQGYGFAKAGQVFGVIAPTLRRAQQLAGFSGRTAPTQLDVEQAKIEKITSQQEALDKLAEEEVARLSGRSGTGRYSLDSQRRGAGLI